MVPRLSSVLSRSKHTFEEHDFSVVCHGCQQQRNISKCITVVSGKTRNYRCSACDDLLVTIEVSADRNFTNGSLRDGDWWSIRPINDLVVHMKDEQLTIPARPRVINHNSSETSVLIAR
jgi:hypothetical protein